MGELLAHLAPAQISLQCPKPPCVARMNLLPYLTRPYMYLYISRCVTTIDWSATRPGTASHDAV